MQFSIRRIALLQSNISAACRLRRPLSKATITTADVTDNDACATAEIRYPDGKLRRLSLSWLRFNCSGCKNGATHQRTTTPAAVLSSVRATPAPRLLYPAPDELRIEWGDGHVSRFTFGQLDGLLAPEESRRPRTLWGRASSPLATTTTKDGTASEARPVPLEEFNGASGYRTVLRNLWTYGVATVTGVQATEAATEAVVRRIGPVLETLYGSMWTFTADRSRQDTAYTNNSLGVHNDTAYLHNSAGLQVFHVIEQAPEGGETCLADGFQAAEILRQENRRHFDLLIRYPVYHEYLETRGAAAAAGEPGSASSAHLLNHMRCLDTVLKLDPEAGDRPYQIRYNPYDLGSLSTLPQQVVHSYLEAYAHLSDILNRQESQIFLSLRPGTVLFLDNWRVLHGRTGFVGRRVVTGCYVSRDAWVSQARVHGVV